MSAKSAKTAINLIPVAIEAAKVVSRQAESYHRSRLEARVQSATSAEIRKATRQEDGLIRSVLTPTSLQRSRQAERTRNLPSSEVKSRINAQGPSTLDCICSWLY